MDTKYPQTEPTIILYLQKNSGNLSLRCFALVLSVFRFAMNSLDDHGLNKMGLQVSIDTDDFGKPLASDGLSYIFFGQHLSSASAR